IGLSNVEDLSWKQRVNLAACINCGRCDSVCPAYASGRELSPRAIVQKLKSTYDKFNIQTEGFFSSGLITENEVWSCTNCGACVEECPAMINHVDYIIDLRRYLVAENRLEQQKTAVFSNLDQNYNAFGLPSYKRNDWLEELGVPLLEQHRNAEYLYYIGDAGAYDPRAQQVVKSFVKILQAAEVDFAIMSHQERNEGEIAKRMGEEGRFQLIAMENIATFEFYDVKKIITHDPHSFNMLKNEYPEFGGHYEVIHHTVLIHQLLEQNRLPVTTKKLEKVVFHDPCNLSRWNSIVDEPRQALSHVLDTPLLEIEQSKDRSFCCGAGGGNYWYKVPEQEKISTLRLRQLTSVNPQTIAVACPYCLMMMEDAVRTSELTVKVRDLAELVYDAMEYR
ncbi:(Fe-S)-binding protein, partial [Effusibacillus lacus]